MDDVSYFKQSIFLRFVTVFFLIMLSQCSIDSDVMALLAIKQRLNSSALADWIGTNPCIWTGIQCGSSNDVVNLSLPMMNLYGTLDHAIGDLSSLTTINLNGNFFSGPIPSELRNCHGLQFLDLSGNKFEGKFSSLFDLTNLTVLNLAENRFNDNLPSTIGGLESLLVLNLSDNVGMGGEIPDEIGNCTRLQRVDLSRNNFSGPIPPSLFQLKDLQALFLNLNKLSGPIDFVDSTAFSLKHLSLNHNELSGHIPGFIFNLSELIDLRLSGNHFSGPIPSSLSNLTKLEVLHVGHNSLVGPIPIEVGNLSALTELHLNFNYLTGSIPRELFDCRNLTSLSLPQNYLSSEIPREIGNLTFLTNLQLNHNQLSSPIPREIGNLIFLTNLQFQFNNLNGTLPVELANCTLLNQIQLGYNSIGGEIPRELGRIPDLSRLYLAHNQLTGIIPRELTALPSLEYIVLSQNSLTGGIPDNFSNLSELLNLELADNQLAGPLPPSISNLRRLQRIDVSGNQLTGNLTVVPRSAGANSQLQFVLLDRNDLTGTLQGNWKCMKSLLTLDLHGNKLSGQIPTEIGDLFQVSSIDFSSNRLSGPLPPELGNLPFLTSLNLSFNGLVGEIPGDINKSWKQNDDLMVDLSNNSLSGKIPESLNLTSLRLNVSNNDLSGSIPVLLQNLSVNNFEGNPGLCGPPLSDNCKQSLSFTDKKLAVGYIILTVVLGCFTTGILLVFLLWFRRTRVRAYIMRCCRGVQVEVIQNNKSTVSRNFFHATLLGDTCLNAMSDNEKDTKVSLAFSDLSRATGGFCPDNILGDGGFGKVYRGVLADGTIVAIKKLTEDGCQGEREFFAELQTIGNIRHKNLVPLLGFCSNNVERLLMYEYMPNNSLDLWLYSRTEGMEPLPWELRMTIAKDVARGLTFLHHFCVPKIIHRDLKASNILLDAEFNAKVADFGLARHLNTYDSHVSTTVAGSLGYIAPEYAQSWRVTTRGDVFSFGVVLLELLSGRRPAGGVFKPMHVGNLVGWVQYLVCKKQILNSFFDTVLGPVKGSVHEIQLMATLEVALRCTQEDPSKRPPMLEVLRCLEEVI